MFVDKATALGRLDAVGYYMASAGGEDLIGWHINRGWAQEAEFYPASQFHDRFYRPDIVQAILDYARRR